MVHTLSRCVVRWQAKAVLAGSWPCVGIVGVTEKYWARKTRMLWIIPLHGIRNGGGLIQHTL